MSTFLPETDNTEADEVYDDATVDESVTPEERYDEPEDVEAAKSAPAKPRRKRAPRKSSAKDVKANRSLAKSAVRTLRLIEAASEDDRALTATLLGCDNDEESLTAYILAPGASNASRTVDDIDALTSADKRDERIVLVADLDEERVKDVWAALRQIGAVEGTQPTSSIHAALALADAAEVIGDEIDGARTLLASA